MENEKTAELYLEGKGDGLLIQTLETVDLDTRADTLVLTNHIQRQVNQPALDIETKSHSGSKCIWMNESMCLCEERYSYLETQPDCEVEIDGPGFVQE